MLTTSTQKPTPAKFRIPLGMHRSVEEATTPNPAFRRNATNL